MKNGFNTEERRQAYKLLVQSYIYLEEPEEADKAMLALLATDHFFEPNIDVDPAEFVSLYERFRTRPLFRIGGKLGLASSAPYATLDYSVGSASDGSAKYSPGFTVLFGVTFEKELIDDKAKRKPILTIAPEVSYSVKKYSETSEVFIDGNENKAADFEGSVKQSFVEVNPLAKWWLTKAGRNLDPFLIGGPGFNISLKGSLDDPRLNRIDGSGTVTGPSIDIGSAYKPLSVSAIIGAGFRYRFGGIYVVPDIRLQYGLTNVVDPANRTIPEAVQDYGWIPNNYRLSSVTFNVGIQYAVFSPKKLIK